MIEEVFCGNWNFETTFFFLPCLPSVLEGYFHSITSFKLYMKKILQTILVWCCFLVPVLLYLILLLHVSAQRDVYIAIYWWQQKCVYRHWVTSVVAELYDYFVNINSWILKKNTCSHEFTRKTKCYKVRVSQQRWE